MQQGSPIVGLRLTDKVRKLTDEEANVPRLHCPAGSLDRLHFCLFLQDA